jgi:hypothetical protein
MIKAMPKFIQLIKPLPPLKPMGQSRRGAMWVLRPLAMVIPKFIQISLPLPPLSALRAAKALLVE